MQHDPNDGVPIFADEDEALDATLDDRRDESDKFAAEVALKAMRAGYDAETLDAMPSLSEGQADTCHVEDEEERIWLSRTGVADGEPFENTVSVERYLNRKWETVAKYDGGELPEDDEDEEDTLSGEFLLRIDLGNAGMSEPEHIAQALAHVSTAIAGGEGLGGNIRDINGNAVGGYRHIEREAV